MLLTYPKINTFKLRAPNAKFGGIGLDVVQEKEKQSLHVYRIENDGLPRKYTINIWKPENFVALALLSTQCAISEAEDLLRSISLCYTTYINNMLSTASELTVQVTLTSTFDIEVEISGLQADGPLKYAMPVSDAVAEGEDVLSFKTAQPHFSTAASRDAENMLKTMQYKTKKVENYFSVAAKLPVGVRLELYTNMSDLPPSIESQLREKYATRKFGLTGAAVITHKGVPTTFIPFPDMQRLVDRYIAKEVLASRDPVDAKAIAAVMSVLTGVPLHSIRVSKRNIHFDTDTLSLTVKRVSHGELVKGGAFVLRDCCSGRLLTDVNEEVWVRDGSSEQFVLIKGAVGWLSSEAGFYAKVGSINRILFGHLCGVAYPDLLLGKLIMTTRLFKNKDGVLCGFNFDRKMFGEKVKQVTEKDYHSALSVQYAFSMYPGVRLPEVTTSSEFDEDVYMHSVPLYYDAEGIRPAELDRTPKAEKGVRFDV